MGEEESKFKQHWRKYKWVYISGAAGLALGVTAGILWSRRTVGTPEVVNGNVIDIDQGLAINSPVSVFAEAVVVPRGHPGYVIQCVETGEIFMSQNQAAKAFDISPTILSQHLNGKLESAGGHTFNRLGVANS